MRQSTPIEHFTDYGYWINADDCRDIAEALREHSKTLRAYDSAAWMHADELTAKARILQSTAEFSDSLGRFIPPDTLQWNDDLPPYAGWWNASNVKDEKLWRWWDGKHWSLLAVYKYDDKKAAHSASRIDSNRTKIYWRWYYPIGARVPRIDSRTGKPCWITHPELRT